MMKITITETIEIDDAVWAREHGLTHSEVRNDVRTYAKTAIQSAFDWAKPKGA